MQLVQLVVLCLGYAPFLGAEPVRPDMSSEKNKRWIVRVPDRVKRDLKLPAKSSLQAAADASAVSAFIRTEDVKDIRIPHSSSEPHARVKRYRQSMNHYPHAQALRVGCRFGTCTVQNLAHQIFQYTDKDKDGTAPANKIGSQGYGRRRRRSAPTRLPRAWQQLLRLRRSPPQAPADGLSRRRRSERLLPWAAFLRS